LLSSMRLAATALRTSIPACAVSACAQRLQAITCEISRGGYDVGSAGVRDATLWRKGGAPVSPLDVISVRLGAPGLRVVETPALKWFRERPSSESPTPLMGGASFPDVNHLFQHSYDSIASPCPQRAANTTVLSRVEGWRARGWLNALPFVRKVAAGEGGARISLLWLWRAGCHELQHGAHVPSGRCGATQRKLTEYERYERR
jgi:hypothetical protein